MVVHGHILWVEDSIFTVRVQYDNQNREIITECEFAYREPAADLNNVLTYDLESDDTRFLDLAGYEYRDMELDRDTNTVIVTYVDEGMEKKWEVDLKPFMHTQK